MSATATPEPPPAPAPGALVAMEPTRKKSYRRKYRKIMVNFEHKMQEGNGLFRDEQRILIISQRLAEETDQLLDLLFQVNSQPQVPKRLRFDLRSKHEMSNNKLESNTEVQDEESGHLALRKARYRLQTGQITVADYEDVKDSILQIPAFAPENSYAALTQSIALHPPPRTETSDDTWQSATPFLTTRQEEQYLQSLDTHVSEESSSPRSHATGNPGARYADKAADRERELQLKNPVSVYNWLRQHEPKVFLQDHEAAGDKPARATGSRISKRNAHRESIAKHEPELYDEDGIAIEPGAGSRGKRKRDDDGGYRPKGGNSRPSKKRKEDPAPLVKKGKKLSIDAR